MNLETKRGGLQSSKEEAAYNRARKRWPTENAELLKTEIDAAGIKRRGKRGIIEDRDRCRGHQKQRNTEYEGYEERAWCITGLF